MYAPTPALHHLALQALYSIGSPACTALMVSSPTLPLLLPHLLLLLLALLLVSSSGLEGGVLMAGIIRSEDDLAGVNLQHNNTRQQHMRCEAAMAGVVLCKQPAIRSYKTPEQGSKATACYPATATPSSP
jgi:hypothetical protein